MSSCEEAIKHFESLQKRYTTQHNGKQCGLVARALESMKESKKRNAGCECCNGFRPDDLGAKVYAWSVQYYEIGDGIPHYISARFCPMCGRELSKN